MPTLYMVLPPKPWNLITKRGPETVLPDARLSIGDHVHSIKRVNSCLIGFSFFFMGPFFKFSMWQVQRNLFHWDQMVNKHHIVVVNPPSWQIQMALHKQRGCLLEFLTNDPTLTNYQCRCQNPHNHSQCQNRQNQQNHSPLGNLQEKAFCYLLTQHPHPHETVITQNSSILRYLLYFGSSTCTIMVLNPGGRVSKSCILNLNHYLYSY